MGDVVPLRKPSLENGVLSYDQRRLLCESQVIRAVTARLQGSTDRSLTFGELDDTFSRNERFVDNYKKTMLSDALCDLQMYGFVTLHNPLPGSDPERDLRLTLNQKLYREEPAGREVRFIIISYVRSL
ncbi:hypothetical protein HYU23_01105 [Candidatus Woesearchaeota archaeon]|nr:hypothetical protein [Candidatus Woesearchaeota archaeon]